MKYLTLLSILVLIACEPKVYFKEAQPIDIEALTSIPAEYRGIYVFASDSTTVRATADVIAIDSYFEYETKLSNAQETEDCKIADGGIYLRGAKKCIPYESIDEDLVRAKIFSVDTIFSFNKYHTAKKYKNKLFMSYGDKEDKWVVNVLSPLGGGSILWELIDIPDKVHVIESISPSYCREMQPDSSFLYIIDPDLQGFQSILDRGFVTSCDTLHPFKIN